MIRRKLPAFNNVFPNATASVALPLGMTYERIFLKLDNNPAGSFVKGDIAKVRLIVNNKVAKEVSGDRLEKINAYKGQHADAKTVLLDFTEVFARDRIAMSAGALPTNGGFVTSATLEVEIKGTANGPRLNGYTVESAPQMLPVDGNGRPILMYHKLIPRTSTFNAAGRFEIPIPYGRTGTSIQRIYIFHGGNVTGAEMRMNNVTIYEQTKEIAEYEQRDNKLSPQANCFVIDFIVDHNLTEIMDTARADTLQLFVDLSAGDTLEYVIECIDHMSNL